MASPQHFRIFPALKPPALKVSDPVFVKLRSEKSTGHASIVQTPETPEGRPVVQFLTDGSTHPVNPARILAVYTEAPLIMICKSTTDYRTLARSQVYKNDAVVEIGSSYGVCTGILAQHANSVFGLEVSPKLVEEARKRYPALRFELLNVLENKERTIELMQGVRKVFVDIGGNRTIGDVVKIVTLLNEALKPDLICIKSEEMVDDAEKHLNGSSDGVIPDGQAWFEGLQTRHAINVSKSIAPEQWYLNARKAGFTRNPLRYPMRVTADGNAICRLHNYKAAGCPKVDAADLRALPQPHPRTAAVV
ncbi:hypothetical protein PhCBS80983_g00419 [Powellomyces hirtus]|uniref:Uncharacterized protein n=1 Tax=Powellomyces hirtus TaxID=109895 RepID=A0A507EHK6_9FUNG|nr:hypothetical protein PhCBS80983_g00419 [Powellomyces hirtus]